MKHLAPKAAYEFLQANPNAVLIDVRSEMEYLFVGHPKDALLIPWQQGTAKIESATLLRLVHEDLVAELYQHPELSAQLGEVVGPRTILIPADRVKEVLVRSFK